jgi:3-hydroxyacyl-[acyl-carrier-protein] dehydratase
MTTLTFDEVKACLKQRFPMLMVDRVLEVELGKKIKAVKNVTGNEVQFLGHFPDRAVMPGTLIIEAIGQAASILFSLTTPAPLDEREFLVLAAVHEMRFMAPVFPGQTMILEISIVKMMPELALVEGIVTVDDIVVTKGKLSFARKVL